MKRGSTLFLRGIIALLAAVVLGTCVLGLPRVIGPDISMGGYDPILFGLYISAIPFFVALYQATKLLGYIDQNKAFSDLSVDALKKIKYSGALICAQYVLEMPYIFYVAQLDDAPGVVAIALVIVFASIAVATFAAVLHRLLKNALEIKSENDLTV